MNENLHTPGRPAWTLAQSFLNTVDRYPNRAALRTFRQAGALTWAELREQVGSLASGLAVSGIGRGSVVATMLRNRPEFFAIDLATVCVGGTGVAVYNTLPATEVAYVLADSGASVVVTELAFLEVVRNAVSQLEVPPEVLTIDSTDSPGLIELAARGKGEFDLTTSVARIAPSDTAALIYTSGTTGKPKGVEITHDNLVAAWEAIIDLEPAAAAARRVLSYLPAAHIGDRLYGYYAAIFSGATITAVENFTDTLAAVHEVQPSLFVGVPRIWEKLKHELDAAQLVSSAPDEARQIAGYSDDSLWVSGSAPIDADLLKYLADVGIRVYEGYGMTEASCVISSNGRGRNRPGTVGQAAKGVEIRIDYDGEILVRGRVVCPGYRNQPDETRAAINPDGWLRTGDLGTLDEQGYLSIIGRKKEIIITATGKNVSPGAIEQRLRTVLPLSNVAVIGDRRPYLVALVELAQAIPTDQMEESVSSAVNEVNRHLSRAEQIKHFAIVKDAWDVESGLVTPTGKLRRVAIAERYVDLVDQLYSRDKPRG